MATIADGGTAYKDPADIVVYEFDWDACLPSGAAIVTSTFASSAIGGDSTTTPVTRDQASIKADERSTQVRVSAGAAGSTWRLTNRVVTDEVPAQTLERSITLRVRNL